MRNNFLIFLGRFGRNIALGCFFLMTASSFSLATASTPSQVSIGEPTVMVDLDAPADETANIFTGEDNNLASVTETEIPTKDLPFFQRILKRAQTAWTDGSLDIYLPLYAWHNRFMYHTGEGSKFNENPWGGGIGSAYYDEDGDYHGLFAMGFKDSNKHFQPVLGYAYVKNWEIADELRFGLGVAAGVSARHEMYYIPFPAALPLVSLEYSNFAIQATYIPDRYNHGNVLFTWARWHFD